MTETPGSSNNVNLPGAGNWNLPFDPRLTTYGSIGTVDSRGNGVTGREVALRRGYIRVDPLALDGYGNPQEPRWLYFLYNPASIPVSYNIQTDPQTVASVYGNSNGTPMGLLDQSLNFSLLFDRTYEVMDGSREGAWRDIRAALAVIGVLDNVGEGEMYTTGSDYNAGPMKFSPSYFHFGNQQGGVTYYGYATNLSYEITHFSKDMIPTRVGMRISASLLPLGPNRGSGGEAGSTPSQEKTGTIDDKEFSGQFDIPEDTLSDIVDQLDGGTYVGPDARLWN